MWSPASSSGKDLTPGPFPGGKGSHGGGLCAGHSDSGTVSPHTGLAERSEAGG